MTAVRSCGLCGKVRGLQGMETKRRQSCIQVQSVAKKQKTKLKITKLKRSFIVSHSSLLSNGISIRECPTTQKKKKKARSRSFTFYFLPVLVY